MIRSDQQYGTDLEAARLILDYRIVCGIFLWMAEVLSEYLS